MEDQELIVVDDWRLYNGCRIVGVIRDGDRKHNFASKALFAVDVGTKICTEIGGRSFKLGKPWREAEAKPKLWDRISAFLKGREDVGTSTEIEDVKSTIDKLRGREPVKADEAE